MRPINELIWHCTATREGMHITVADIRKWHLDRGWRDIGYHKVVYLDGSVHEGRPINQMGAHTKGHNRGTLGYAYVGGVTDHNVDLAKDTRTLAQKKTMERLTREACLRYGVTKVTGHNEYAAKACPSFNVQTDKWIQAGMRPAVVRPPKVVSPPEAEIAPVPQPKATGPWSTIWKLLKIVFAVLGGRQATGG